MKKLYSFIIVLIMVINASIAVLAEDEETYATGAILMTEEEIENFKANVPEIIAVKPNALFYERLQEEYSGSFSVENITQPLAEYGEEIVGSLDNTSAQLLSDEESSLPSKVDNSTETTFPNIKNQGKLNSCLGWSLAYYQLTNNANRIRGTAARNGSTNINSNIYSPNWVYNLGNYGDNSGMKGKFATNVLYTYGCPTINEIPIKTSSATSANYLSWYPIASVWENALYNKCDLYYGTVNPHKLDTPITAPNSDYLDNIKKILADGYVVTIETFVEPNGSTYLPIVKTGKTSTNSSSYVWTEVREVSDGGHAVTIVGYDDGFKVDINGDKTYQTGEYGAFKIANSWGTSASKHNKGYVWLSYDALNAVSSVSSSNHSDRTPAFRNGDLYYFIKPQKEYKPLLTATVGINTKHRDELIVKIGIEDSENSSNYYEKYITRANYSTDSNDENYLDSYIAFGYGYGGYNLSGESGYGTGYVTFDFSSLLQEFEMKNNHNYNLYIELYNYSDSESTINSFTLKDHNTGNTFTSNELPLSTNSNSVAIKVNVAYLSSILSVRNHKIFVLKFNSKLNENTVNDTNVFVSNNNDVLMDLSLVNTEDVILILTQNSFYDNDFYTLSVSTMLKSIGGNGLAASKNYPFYVPFH